MKLTNIKLKLKGGVIMPLKYVKSVNANEKEIDFDELTPEQQMEIRKNLGLYYEGTGDEEKTVKGSNAGSKISDDTPAKEDIIKINFMETDYEPVFSDIEGDYGYYIGTNYTSPTINLFQVITEDGYSNPKGIYSIGNMGVFATLYYKEETTVVHKIDEKYLPEIEIKPEIETVTFLQSLESIQASDKINLNDLFSNEDVNVLKEGKIVYGKYNSGIGDLQSYIIIPKKSIMGGNDEFLIIGNCINNNIGYNINYYLRYETNIEKYRVLRDSLFVSGLPTNEMTSEEIIALGFALDCFYNSPNLKYIYNYTLNNRYNILYCSNGTICFQDDVNRYKLVNNLASIYCTVTPL